MHRGQGRDHPKLILAVCGLTPWVLRQNCARTIGHYRSRAGTFQSRRSRLEAEIVANGVVSVILRTRTQFAVSECARAIGNYRSRTGTIADYGRPGL